MARDSEQHVKSCSVCNKNKKTSRPARSALGSYHAGFPMERVHLDIVGPFHISKSGNRYILVMVDQFTKWVELAALPEQNAQLTAKRFFDQFICRFGCPLEVHTDQGRNFESNLFQAFCKVFEISKTRTTPYRPCSNGQCERFNRTILQMVRSYISRDLKDWDEHLPFIAMALHSMQNESTGFSANRLMLGRETIQPIDLIIGQFDSTPYSPNEWVQDLSNNLSQAHKIARERVGQTQLRQKRDYDLKLRTNYYHIGDVVFLRDSSTKIGVSKKLRPPWSGPYIIARARSPLYEILGMRKSQYVHHDRLKPCNDSDFPMWLQRKRHALLTNSLSTRGECDDEPLLPDEPLGLNHLFGYEDRDIDLDSTLPYMLGDDMQGRADSSSDSSVDSGGDSDIHLPMASLPIHDQIVETRTGRKIKLPARYMN